MAQTNKVITDSSGNEITYYGCATVSDACQLGGVATDVDTANQLIILDDVLDNHTYNVQLTQNPKIEYCDSDQAVAYDDLVVYQGTQVAMTKPANQKLGVLLLNSSLVAQPLSYKGTGTDDYLAFSDVQLSNAQVNKSKTTITPGYIRVSLYSMSNTYVNGSSMQGYEIVLQNFLEDLYDGTSLEIKRISFQDSIDGANPTVTTTYNTSVDASAFNITGTTQKRAVVENGSQVICGMIKPSAADTKYANYTNFDNTTPQTLSLMILSANGNANPLYTDQLLSTIEIDFQYLKTSEDGTGAFTAVSTVTIELWTEYALTYAAPESAELQVEDDGSLPEVEDNESGKTISIDPSRTILYTTTTELPLAGYTDALGSAFAGGAAVESAGYATLANGKLCGYIQYTSTPSTIGTNTLFSNNANILTTVTIPKGVTHIADEAFYQCENLSSVIIPNTVEEIGDHAFYNAGITTLSLSSDIQDSNSAVMIKSDAFSRCTKLKQLTVLGKIIVSDRGFRECFNLTNVLFPLSNGQIFPVGYECFASCSSLITDLLKYTQGQGCCLGRHAFYGCVSLQTITLNGFANWFPFSGNHGDEWKAWFLSLALPVIGQIITAINSAAYTDSNAFHGCVGLKNIIINDYVDDSGHTYYSVGKAGFRLSTFEGCINVENIYCNSKHPPYLGAKNIWKAGAINPRTCQLYIPEGRTTAYNSKAQWGDFPLENIHEISQEEFEEVRNSL